MEAINAVLYVLAGWSILGGIVYGVVVIKNPEISPVVCGLLTLLCGFLAWGMVISYMLIEALKDEDGWEIDERNHG